MLNQENYEHKTISTNGINLHVVVAGPEDGKPLFLLHGFPEFWGCWHHQIPYFAEQGYRVIVPDQRGYNLSDKPPKAKDYHIDILAKDMVGLADALGYETFYLVGHDWGAAVSWWMAHRYPERIIKMGILNVPYPSLLAKAFRSSFKQLLRSWYMFFFQIPRIPEWLLSMRNYNTMLRMMKNSSLPDAFNDEYLNALREAWSQPGALRGMINWYRAMFRAGVRGGESGRGKLRITVPTLILWGEQDIALEKHLAEASAAICDDAQVIFFPDATHWVQHDKPNEVNEHLANFFKET